MIEQPPILNQQQLKKGLLLLSNNNRSAISKFQDDYLYWSDVKYKHLEGCSDAKEIWALIKAVRQTSSTLVCPKYNLQFSTTNYMMRICHMFDMQFGGLWGSESILPKGNRERYLIGSTIEEAISSSQMEGASTTRKVAKEMLQKHLTPKDKSQKMIHNNFQTIQYLANHSSDSLTPELIKRIHSLITTETLENQDDSGRFRSNNNVVVENAVTHEIVHTPPCYGEIPSAIDWLCDFANGANDSDFIHPIIKAIIIHFFISYLHPFVDGNGRTARALFHWYMLKEGYWLTQYLSISRTIYASKTSYEKAFLYSESDHNDIGYFITYHLKALERSFEDLKNYIARKTAEGSDKNRLLRIGNINERQAEILYIMAKDRDMVITVKDITSRFLITPTTAKHDLIGLVEQRLLSEIPLNKQKKGYIRGELFDSKVESTV